MAANIEGTVGFDRVSVEDNEQSVVATTTIPKKKRFLNAEDDRIKKTKRREEAIDDTSDQERFDATLADTMLSGESFATEISVESTSVGPIESFGVSGFDRSHVAAMRDDTVECLYESLEGGLGCFRFRICGLLNRDGFTAQIAHGIAKGCAPFDKHTSIIAVTAARVKNSNECIRNLGDKFPQMRYVIIEDGITASIAHMAALIVRVSERLLYLIVYEYKLTIYFVSLSLQIVMPIVIGMAYTQRSTVRSISFRKNLI
jgi:hypothetical protein